MKAQLKIQYLNSDWRIAVDATNYILQEKRTGLKGKSKGQEIWEDRAYCSKLEDVFSSACEHITMSNWGDIPKILEEMETVREIVLKFKTL